MVREKSGEVDINIIKMNKVKYLNYCVFYVKSEKIKWNLNWCMW